MKMFFRKLFERIMSYTSEFTRTTTLHGVKYLSMKNLHPCEILLWFVVFSASVFGASKLIGQSYQHYVRNPTVITIEKNYRDWIVPFPAATFCFLDNLDPKRARTFISDVWRVKPSPGDEILGASDDEVRRSSNYSAVELSLYNETIRGENAEHSSLVSSVDVVVNSGTYRYYFIFLQNLVNQTFANMATLKQYVRDDTILRLNVKSTVLKVIREHKMKSTFYTDDFNNTEFYLTPTEMGMCYVHGGKLADYITLESASEIRYNFEPPACSHEDTLCFARTEGIPSDIKYYVHSPYELPDSEQPYFLVTGRMDVDVAFSSLETTVSAEIEKLSPFQRHCRFMDEPTRTHLRVYSFNLCRMQCRKELSFKLCGCAPYFYPEESRIPTCGVKGLACLAQYSEMIITLRTKRAELPCDCLPHCKDVRLTVDKETIRSWMFPVPFDIRFRWAIGKFSKIRLRRDVIYSFTDLVVSFGGIATFFLGCSVLSFIEIIYFFTLRLFWFVRANAD